MSHPLVSIAITSYQHAGFIGAALDSVLAQTYPNIEIIVGDDGSTDGTAEILDDYARRYPDRITVLPRVENGGIPGIRPNGDRVHRACRGKYVCLLDGDDMYLPGKIAKQVAWLEEDERRVICTHDVEIFDSDTDAHLHYSSEFHPLSSGVGAERIVRRDFGFWTVSVMFRASAAPMAELEPRMFLLLDWWIWTECLAKGGHYGYVDGVLARYRRHGSNATRSPRFEQVRLEDSVTMLALVQVRHPHLSRACRIARAGVLYWYALDQMQAGKIEAARQMSYEAVCERFGIMRLLFALFTRLPERFSKAVIRLYLARPKGFRTFTVR